MKRIRFVFFLVTIYYSLFTIYSNADTIYTKDNKEMKGIVVEEYKDRLLLSTVDGEKTIMKDDIKELYYDTEEQNIMALAEQAREKGDYIKAFIYYDKAFKLNPDSKPAKDGIVFLQGYLFKKDMSQKEEAINRHNEFEERGGGPVLIKTDEEKFRENLKKLRRAAGIVLKSKGNATQIESVMAGSPAYEAGIRQGDTLIAIWGRLVGYMSLPDVVEALLEKTSLETKCTIERAVDVKINEKRKMLSGTADLIGVNLKMEIDGLTVSGVRDPSGAKEAGLKANDLITGINGNITRYMPLKRAIELIKSSKGETVKLTFRRETVMWGKGGE